jgi:cytochrome c oxidase subunit 2
MTRRARACLAIGVLALGLVACSQDSPSLLDSRAPEARSVERVWWLMFALAAAVYMVVAGFIVVAIVRGRRRAKESAAPEREPKDDTFIWFGGIAAPVVILAVLAVVTIRTTQDLRRPEQGELRIEVTAKRWWWDVRYPDAGVATATEIHIPVGRPIDFVLTSDNVIHSFWVPQLAGKLDTIPGQTNHLRLKATEAGTYRGECAEYCGIQHAHMSYVVIADAPLDFERWLARRSGGAGVSPTSEEAARGQLVFNRESCAGCHTVRGSPANGTVGPDLSDFGSRQSIGSLTIPNNRANLARWVTDPESIKPGNLMPPTALSADDIAAVTAYLEGLK